MVGQKQVGRTVDVGHNIALAEAQAIDRGDRGDARAGAEPRVPERRELARAPRRCAAARSRSRRASLAFDANHDADQTIQTLRDLFVGLRTIDAPKTLILISEGFVLSTTTAMIIELGTLAAAARTSLYALKLDNQMFDITDARMPINPFADRQARPKGSRCWPARRAARCSPSPAPARRCSSGSSRSCPATTCSASNPIRATRTASRTRSAIDVPRRARSCDRAGRCSTPRPNGARGRRASPRQAVAAALGSPLLVVGAAAARRDVLAAGPGARQGAAADPRRHRHRLPVVEGRLGRLHHHRSRRPHGRQPGGRHAAAAGDERRAVALQYTAGASLPPATTR